MAEVTVDSLLKRANLFLEDCEFNRADEYAERILDIDPERAEAYVIKLLCDLRIISLTQLKASNETFTENTNYRRALRFADEKLKAELNGCAASVAARVAEIKAEEARAAENERQRIISVYNRKKSNILLMRELRISPYKGFVSAGWSHSLGLKNTGEVLSAGNNYYEWSEKDVEYLGHLDVGCYKNVEAIAAAQEYSILLFDDGTVKGIGKNHGKCDFSQWRNIVAISAKFRHAVGLKRDGTVVATGLNDDGQCNVYHWSNIKSVYAYPKSTVGIKKDGTVVVAGELAKYDYSKLRDIIAIYETTALQADGTLVSVFSDSDDCKDLQNRDIIDITDGGGYLCADGTIITFGNNNCGRLNTDNWRNLVTASLGSSHSLGLAVNGSVYAAGFNKSGQCNVRGWKLIATQKELLCEVKALKAEYANLKGLFTGKRKKQIEERLETIDGQIEFMKMHGYGY